MKWQYKCQLIPIFDESLVATQAGLDEAGHGGWELVSLMEKPQKFGVRLISIFKRPVSN